MNRKNNVKDRFLKKEIQYLNRHLPKKRSSLADLMEQDKPKIDTKDGKSHRFKRKELQYLSDLLPKNLHKRLRLPIIITISPQFGRGAAKISGEAECLVVLKILEKEKEEEGELLIYRPEIRALRKKLPTTTQYAFQISPPTKSNIRQGF